MRVAMGAHHPAAGMIHRLSGAGDRRRVMPGERRGGITGAMRFLPLPSPSPIRDVCNAAGKRVASGVYFYRIKAGDFRATRKMIVLH
jgi:hypothetical protein